MDVLELFMVAFSVQVNVVVCVLLDVDVRHQCAPSAFVLGKRIRKHRRGFHFFGGIQAIFLFSTFGTDE